MGQVPGNEPTGYEPTGGRPIGCLLSEAEQAKRGWEIADQLFGHVAETRELDDGYAIRLPGGDEWFERVAAFVAAERRCCPFFRFEIVSEPDGGPIWLSLRGEAGVKDFVATGMLGLADPEAGSRADRPGRSA